MANDPVGSTPEEDQTRWLNCDDDLINLETESLEGPCDPKYFTYTTQRWTESYGTTGRSSFLLTTEAPELATCKDFRGMLTKDGSLISYLRATELAKTSFKKGFRVRVQGLGF